MGEWMDSFLEKLKNNRKEIEGCGGPERISQQHHLGKLTARERISHLLDEESFLELGSAVRDINPFRDPGEIPRPSPADGVVMGLGRINKRKTIVYAMDFSVMSGSVGNQGIWKIAELVQMAGQMQVPIIGLIDTAGSRMTIEWGNIGLYGLGRVVRNYCLYSGIIPRITLLLGPCTGPFSQIPALSDFLIINRKTGFLWFGGGKTSPDSGDAVFHMEKSGQCDLLADNDGHAIGLARRLLDFIPQNCWEKPRQIESTDDPQRSEAALLDVMPNNPRFTYDMHEIIDLIVDDGEFFELKADFAPNLITGFARFDGIATGIVASNPDELSGIMEPDSSDKYDNFMMFLDAFDIPIVNISDTTAYPPGDKWERLGVIRHGAKNLHGYSTLTNPKITIVLRRSYGGSNITMGCSKMGPDFIFAWPTVEFAPTGPDAVVQAVFHKELKEARLAGNYDEVYQEYLKPLKAQWSVFNMAKNFTDYYTVHEIIDPRETRRIIIESLHAARDKKETLPNKRRYVKPA